MDRQYNELNTLQKKKSYSGVENEPDETLREVKRDIRLHDWRNIPRQDTVLERIQKLLLWLKK